MLLEISILTNLIILIIYSYYLSKELVKIENRTYRRIIFDYKTNVENLEFSNIKADVINSNCLKTSDL